MAACVTGAWITGVTGVVDFAWSRRQGCGCSGCYITGDGCNRTNCLWAMFTNVVVGTLVLSSTNDLY